MRGKKGFQFTLMMYFCLLSMQVLAADAASTSVEGKGDSLWYRIFKGFTLSPGISVKSPTFELETKADGYSGRITASPGSLGFDLDLALRGFDIPGTVFGLTLFSHSASFYTYKQFDDNPDDSTMKDVGTKVTGWYSYLVPAVYYIKRENNRIFRLGGGIGYGALSYNGNLVLTDDGILPASPTRTAVSGVAEAAWAYMVFYDIDFANSWRLRVFIGGPRSNDKDYRVQLDEFNIALSRRFTLIH